MKPSEDFWMLLGIAAVVLAMMGGFALIALASGGN